MHKFTFSIKLSVYLVASLIGLKQAVGHLCCYLFTIIYWYMGIYVLIMRVFALPTFLVYWFA